MSSTFARSAGSAPAAWATPWSGACSTPTSTSTSGIARAPRPRTSRATVERWSTRSPRSPAARSCSAWWRPTSTCSTCCSVREGSSVRSRSRASSWTRPRCRRRHRRPFVPPPRSYGLDSIIIDGNDADAVYLTARACLDRARSGLGPSLVEARTYRSGGHSRADPATYRPAAEVATWAAYDPIEVYRARLIGHGIAAADLASADELADADVDAATVEAKASAPPGDDLLLSNVWSDGVSSWRN